MPKLSNRPDKLKRKLGISQALGMLERFGTGSRTAVVLNDDSPVIRRQARRMTKLQPERRRARNRRRNAAAKQARKRNR